MPSNTVLGMVTLAVVKLDQASKALAVLPGPVDEIQRLALEIGWLRGSLQDPQVPPWRYEAAAVRAITLAGRAAGEHGERFLCLAPLRLHEAAGILMGAVNQYCREVKG